MRDVLVSTTDAVFYATAASTGVDDLDMKNVQFHTEASPAPAALFAAGGIIDLGKKLGWVTVKIGVAIDIKNRAIETLRRIF